MTSNQIEYAKHTENVRHNLATEGIASGNLKENVRHNKASEGISSGNLDELKRHNLISESLTNQQILNNYTVGIKQAHAAQSSAAAAQKQAQVASQRQFEDARHNIQSEIISMSEIEKKYANLGGQLGETVRHNREMENLKGSEIAFGFAGDMARIAGNIFK